jgi:hypothetical protein
MINKEALVEKLKYLITTNAKSTMFDIINIYVEFDYLDQKHEKISEYDLDVKFDYAGAFDFEMSTFLYDIQKMEQKLRQLVGEYVLTPEGKIVSRSKTNVAMSDAKVFNIEFAVDEKHIFDLGYTFYFTDYYE